jgi:Rrf2 family transcriptional regulator, cysteine metabolism repressor
VILSQRTQYGVRAVLELAKRNGSGPVKASKIASTQSIPVRFLENILGQLRQAGIVESQRGKEGGYMLARPAADVSVGEVVRLVQGPVSMIECADVSSSRQCSLRSGCVLLPMWERAHNAMMDVYDGTTFADLVEQERAAAACEVVDYAI